MAHVADDGTVTISRRVVRVDRSPMNEKIRVVQLACGHDITTVPPVRAPRVGALRACWRCSETATKDNR